MREENINITEAIRHLPEAFITPEMALEAAKEHRAELVNSLPEQYVTPELLDVLFASENRSWQHWDLSRIPEGKRSYSICLKAVRNHAENFKYVPDRLKDKSLVREILSMNGMLSRLPSIPAHLWDTDLIAYGLEMLCRKSQSGCNNWKYGGHDTEKEQFLCAARIFLSHIPEKLKSHRLYLELARQDKIPADILGRLVPPKYKQSPYYRITAVRHIGEVGKAWLDYDTVWKALEYGKDTLLQIYRNPSLREWVEGIMDNRVADRIVELAPEYFNLLPEAFQTPERMVRILDGKSPFNGWDLRMPPSLMTEEVCKALARRDRFYPEIPKERWTPEFVDYLMAHAPGMSWVKQMPKDLQTEKVAEKVLREHEEYFHCLRPRFISPEKAKELCRKRHCHWGYFPRHVKEFCAYTSLPAVFFGNEVPFESLKEHNEDNIYCRLGLTYIALFKPDGCNTKHHLVVTRHANRYIPAETVFDKQVASFHRTWLEKMICDNDPQFKKPSVDKGLKDVQALCYYGVEHIRSVWGCDLYRNTFMGHTVGYCIKKGGITYHDSQKDRLVSGLKYKLRQMREAVAAGDMALESQVLDLETVHNRMGYCMAGIEAFAEDYGLDIQARYTVRQLKEAVSCHGYKPSLEIYKRELGILGII